MDLVVRDPPYYDNVMYAELALDAARLELRRLVFADRLDRPTQLALREENT